MNIVLLSRREFLMATGLAGAGLLLGGGRRAAAEILSSRTFEPSVYLQIDRVKGISVFIPAPEVGTNIRTALTMALADELDADVSTIHVHQAPPDEKFGHQVTGGSRSIRTHLTPFREVGARAREMLMRAAADQWKVSPPECRTEKGRVLHPDGEQSMPYLELADAAAQLTPGPTPSLKGSRSFSYIGKGMVSLEAEEMARGQTKFGMDARVEGLLYAVCVRPPVKHAKIRSFDAAKALAKPGVVSVKQIGSKIGVFARNTWAAMQASNTIEVEWDIDQQNVRSSEAIRIAMEEGLDEPREVLERHGDVEKGFAESEVLVETSCFVPILAHAPMEPPTCTAWVRDDQAEIWLAAQNFNSARGDLPKWTGLPPDKITVHPLRVGGGFGRKLRLDYVEETIQLSKAVNAPVKLMFTRTNDLRHGFYRHPMAYRLKAGLKKNGQPVVFDFAIAGEAKKQYGESYLDLAPNRLLRGTTVEIPLEFGPLRAPTHNAKVCAWEGFLDEMAVHSGIDPLTYRLALYGDEETIAQLGWESAPAKRPNLVKLLRLIRERSAWNSKPDVGYGVATFEGYGSSIALVALVPRKESTRVAESFFAVVDCGRVVNPLGAAAQVEGGIMDGIGAALAQQITLKNGRVEQTNFNDYPLLRITQAPTVDVHFVLSEQNSEGLGEVPYPPAIAAFCNAVSAARGQRITELPVLRS